MFLKNYLNEKNIDYDKVEIAKSYQEEIDKINNSYKEYLKDNVHFKKIDKANTDLKKQIDKEIPEVI